MRTEATEELLTRPLPINPSPPQSTWLRGGTWLAWVTAGEGGRNVQEQRRSQPPSGAQSGRGGWSWAWGCTAALPGPRRPTFHPDTCSGTSASPQFPVCAPYTGSFKNANLTASFSARPTKPPRRLLTTLRRTPSPPLPPRGPLHTDAACPPPSGPRPRPPPAPGTLYMLLPALLHLVRCLCLLLRSWPHAAGPAPARGPSGSQQGWGQSLAWTRCPRVRRRGQE